MSFDVAAASVHLQLPPFICRYVPGEYKKYNNNWDWAEDKRCVQPASTATCSVKCHIMSQLHLVPLPQEHAASIQPLDPDLLEGQASYL